MKTVAVVGLGYVGLGLAVALSKKMEVIGYDNNPTRITELNEHIDHNHLISSTDLAHKNLAFTNDCHEIKHANFFIVSVSTPAYSYEIPNLEPLANATKDLSRILKKKDIVVFESTVYPGTTEEICIPILEQGSGLKNGEDFHIGYSPERINPGDNIHTLSNITKIISAQDEKTLHAIEHVYNLICDSVYPVSSIKTAEATKLLENTQRDVNIALMNEFTKIMHALDLNMHEIIEAAKTKWGFVPLKPGFVGGHCISIDPYYLAYEAKRHGVQPDLILMARRINNEMSHFVIESLIQILLKHHVDKNNLHIGLFGMTYKENVIDFRNSLSIKLLNELKTYGFDCQIHDPLITKSNANFQTDTWEEMNNLSVAIILVGHQFYKKQGLKNFTNKCKNPAVILDIPNLFVEDSKSHHDIIYWSL